MDCRLVNSSRGRGGGGKPLGWYSPWSQFRILFCHKDDVMSGGVGLGVQEGAIVVDIWLCRGGDII